MQQIPTFPTQKTVILVEGGGYSPLLFHKHHNVVANTLMSPSTGRSYSAFREGLRCTDITVSSILSVLNCLQGTCPSQSATGGYLGSMHRHSIRTASETNALQCCSHAADMCAAGTYLIMTCIHSAGCALLLCRTN